MQSSRIAISSLLFLSMLCLSMLLLPRCGADEPRLKQRVPDDGMLQNDLRKVDAVRVRVSGDDGRDDGGRGEVGMKGEEGGKGRGFTAGTAVPKWVRSVRSPVELDQIETDLRPISNFSELPLSGPRGKETPVAPKAGRYCENGFERAGFPNVVGRFAKPTTDTDHQVGYVGGGTWFGGACRRTTEGTFGMDYVGRWFTRSTWMHWSHGALHQGGSGRYETDGPKLCPE